VFLGANGNGAPMLPILYVTANLAFNICSLLVVRTSGARHFAEQEGSRMNFTTSGLQNLLPPRRANHCAPSDVASSVDCYHLLILVNLISSATFHQSP